MTIHTAPTPSHTEPSPHYDSGGPTADGYGAPPRDAAARYEPPWVMPAPAGTGATAWPVPPSDDPTVERTAEDGQSARARWELPALAVLLVGTAALYLWNLAASGWANSFYSAAAQAGSKSWEAWFFGSSDAGNAITVDKPPASLWVMGLSVRIFGLSSWSLLVPQVLMAVATVALVYVTVRRVASAAAGLVAGAALALTPVAVLMFRFNNPDALLVLLMAAATWATLKAVQDGRTRWMVLAGVALGFGFLTKQLQVFLVLPALGGVFLLAGPGRIGRRLLQSLAGIGALIVSAGWWIAAVELTPASHRPYIGGSQHNSILELTLGYNGFGRLTGNETGSVGGGGNAGGGNWGATGIGRLFNSEIGGQITWLLPTSLLLGAAALWFLRRAPRTSLLRATLLAWGGWLVVTWLTFSFMAGIFHAYYTVALAPAVAAVAGLGGWVVWRNRRSIEGRVVLAAASLLTGWWGYELLDRTPDWTPWLRWVVAVAGVVGAVGLVVGATGLRRVGQIGIAAALLAALAGPAAYSLQTVSIGHTGSIVDAGPTVSGGRGPGGFGNGGGRGGNGRGFGGQAPTGLGAPGGGVPGGARGATGGAGGLLNAPTVSTAVKTALSTDAGSYRWVAAAIGSQTAAGYQLSTQLPVMAIGGFNGSDPSPTLAQFQAYVAAKEIHYFISSGTGGGFGAGGASSGGSNISSQISAWVAAHYTATTIGTVTVYDLSVPAT